MLGRALARVPAVERARAPRRPRRASASARRPRTGRTSSREVHAGRCAPDGRRGASHPRDARARPRSAILRAPWNGSSSRPARSPPAISVAAGAFGAHALKARLSPDLLAVFETGARYEMYHALGLVAAGWAAPRAPGGAARVGRAGSSRGDAALLGSLYALALSGVRALGAVTPFGASRSSRAGSRSRWPRRAFTRRRSAGRRRPTPRCRRRG